MNWVIKIIFVALSELMMGVVEYLGSIISNIFDFMYQVNKGLGLDKIANYTVVISLSLLTFLAIKQAIDVYALQTDGDPDSDPMEIITRAAVAVATIMCGQDIVDYLITKSGTLCKEVAAKLVGEERSVSQIMTDALAKLLSMGTIIAVIQAVFLAITIIALILFIIQAAKRGAELCLFQILLPLLALDMLTTSREKWNAFKNELLICIFGYIIQVLCFNIFMVLLGKAITIDGISESPGYFIAPLGWLILVLSAPKWLQKFMYSSGVGNGARSGMSMGASLIPHLLKR